MVHIYWHLMVKKEETGKEKYQNEGKFAVSLFKCQSHLSTSPHDKTRLHTIQYNTTLIIIQEIKTKVTKYLSKGNILRSTLYKRFPKIKDEWVKSRI